MMGKSFLLVTLFTFAFMLHLVSAIKTIECQDGKITGITELVDSVEKTVEDCTNTTTSKADLFSCIFKRMDFFDDNGSPAAEKVKTFFQRVFSSKTMVEAEQLTKNLMTCAETYAKVFGSVKSTKDLGDAGSAFANCFFDATKKFTAYIRKTCKAVETADGSVTSDPRK